MALQGHGALLRRKRKQVLHLLFVSFIKDTYYEKETYSLCQLHKPINTPLLLITIFCASLFQMALKAEAQMLINIILDLLIIQYWQFC
jgi:hypothetical protein